jgi:hypothetical protein
MPAPLAQQSLEKYCEAGKEAPFTVITLEIGDGRIHQIHAVANRTN